MSMDTNPQGFQVRQGSLKMRNQSVDPGLNPVKISPVSLLTT